jgi:UDP-N-acetylenolpyruvoylglucosamine reductase
MKILPNLKEISLKENTSMKIGPTVKYLEVTDEVQLLEILKYAKAKKLKIHVLGEGTNSYFANNLKKYFFYKIKFFQRYNLYPRPPGVGERSGYS